MVLLPVFNFLLIPSSFTLNWLNDVISYDVVVHVYNTYVNKYKTEDSYTTLEQNYIEEHYSEQKQLS